MITVLYFILILFLISFLLTVIFHMIYDIYANIAGGPFVPTKNKEIKTILKEVNLKKGDIFYDLGSGDGRVVRFAVKKYGVIGYGFEINPLLIFWSRFVAKIQRLDNCFFVKENLFSVNLSKAQYIFLFLMPKTLKKIKNKLIKEARGALIISHGFKIENFDQFLIKKINHKPFPTYFYRIKKVST